MDRTRSWDIKFTTNDKQADQFLENVVSLVTEKLGRPARVLDVGCGDAGKVFRLACRWPEAVFTGVDISEPNVRAANERRSEHGPAERFSFHASDYMGFATGQHDVILADSVLHLIPGSTDRLFAKLASELAPGGLLIFSMPSTCLHNTLLTFARRVLRLCRSRVTDGLVHTFAKMIHGRSCPPEFIRERIHYMYLVPERWGSPALEARLAAEHQLRLEGSYPWAHTSLGQQKHRLWCFRNAAKDVARAIRHSA